MALATAPADQLLNDRARLRTRITGPMISRRFPVLMVHGGPRIPDYLAPAAGIIDDLCPVHRYDQRGTRQRPHQAPPNPPASETVEGRSRCGATVTASPGRQGSRSRSEFGCGHRPKSLTQVRPQGADQAVEQRTGALEVADEAMSVSIP